MHLFVCFVSGSSCFHSLSINTTLYLSAWGISVRSCVSYLLCVHICPLAAGHSRRVPAEARNHLQKLCVCVCVCVCVCMCAWERWHASTILDSHCSREKGCVSNRCCSAPSGWRQLRGGTCTSTTAPTHSGNDDTLHTTSMNVHKHKETRQEASVSDGDVSCSLLLCDICVVRFGNYSRIIRKQDRIKWDMKDILCTSKEYEAIKYGGSKQITHCGFW